MISLRKPHTVQAKRDRVFWQIEGRGNVIRVKEMGGVRILVGRGLRGN